MTGATHCGAGTNTFWLWLWLIVMGKIGFDVVYDITLVHIRNCLLLLMPKAKLFTSTQLISGTLKNQLIHAVTRLDTARVCIGRFQKLFL